MKKHEQFRPISSILNQVLKTKGLYRPVLERELLGRWEEVVGPRVSAEVRLVDVADGVLLLKTASSSWMTEVRFQKRSIIEKANQILGRSVIRDLRFV